MIDKSPRILSKTSFFLLFAVIMKVLLGLFALFVAVQAAPPNWVCGTPGTEDLSYNIVKNECPNSIPGIELCCQAHDSTYFTLIS
jgi:hypothetical protein